MQETVHDAIGRFHRAILTWGRWSIPAAFLIASAVDLTDDRSGYNVRWYVYLTLGLVTTYLAKRKDATATPLILVVAGLVGVAPFLDVWTETDLDLESGTALPVVVVLGIYLALTAKRPKPVSAAAYLGYTLIVAIQWAIVDGIPPEQMAVRALVAVMLTWIGGAAFVRLKRELLEAISAAERATQRSEAAAAFSEAMLTGGIESLPAASASLAERLDVDRIEMARSDQLESPSLLDHHFAVVGASGPIGRIGVEGAIDPQVVAVLRTVSGMLAGAWERADALERLEELIRSKDQLVASVSHELRTPLTGILGFTESLLDFEQDLSPMVEEFLGIIHDQSRDMADIIEDLLAAARADIGTLSIRTETIDLARIVEGVLATARIQSLSTGHTIAVDIGSVMVNADGLRSRQIVRNLMTNAFRYGGPSVNVRIGSDETSAWVEVSDNGPGISGEERDRLFEPYFRAQQVPTQPGSVGLGLAVSRQLAQLMGGNVELLDTDGDTTFRLSLVRADVTQVLAEVG